MPPYGLINQADFGLSAAGYRQAPPLWSLLKFFALWKSFVLRRVQDRLSRTLRAQNAQQQRASNLQGEKVCLVRALAIKYTIVNLMGTMKSCYNL